MHIIQPSDFFVGRASRPLSSDLSLVLIVKLTGIGLGTCSMEAAKVESFLIVAEHHSECSLALAVASFVAFSAQRGSCFLGLMFGVHLEISVNKGTPIQIQQCYSTIGGTQSLTNSWGS